MVRKSIRSRSSAIVGVIRAHGRETAFLRDFSNDGVCVDGLRDVLAGDKLSLHCKGALVLAEVRWVRGQRVGLCFTPDCEQGEKARFLSAVSRGLKPAQASRIFGFSELA
ncbi:MAG: PilZ domain-containing protein [Rhodobacteraceae bacterium]|nr:PilZ domain-containing protein [Paracoccaceae bacterium]